MLFVELDPISSNDNIGFIKDTINYMCYLMLSESYLPIDIVILSVKYDFVELMHLTIFFDLYCDFHNRTENNSTSSYAPNNKRASYIVG